MKFDIIENLTEQEVQQLYEDSLFLACASWDNAYGGYCSGSASAGAVSDTVECYNLALADHYSAVYGCYIEPTCIQTGQMCNWSNGNYRTWCLYYGSQSRICASRR